MCIRDRCIEGNYAKNTYVTLNFNKSGMEFWRRIHKNNDPKTFGTIDNHLNKIRAITTGRCKNVDELRNRLNDLELAYNRYYLAGGKPVPEEQQKHELTNITPIDILSQWRLMDNFSKWSCKDVKNRMKDLFQVSYDLGLDSNVKHSIYNVNTDDNTLSLIHI